jgi:hypothetical protein
MGTFEQERAQCELCWSRSGSSQLTLCLQRLRHHRPANNEQNVSLPSGRWENFKSLQRVQTVVDRSRSQLCRRESNQARQPFSHRGDGKCVRPLQHAPPVVDQSVCNSVSVSRGKHVSNFPIGAMGNFERGWHVHMPGRTRLDPNRTARVKLGMSARHFPIGAMETFQVLCGTYIL